MTSEVQHPDIRYVVNPVHLDETPIGTKPRKRHYPDCSHFEWPNGMRLGTPILATDEQMRTLKPCKTCVDSKGSSSTPDRDHASGARTSSLCPDCNEMLPLTGRCFNCND